MRFSQAQYVSYLAKRSGSAPSDPGVEREKDLHQAIRDYCASRNWIVFHGSTAHATKRTIGEPDFIILCPNSKFFLIECKSRIGKLTREQQGMAMWASKLQHTIHLIRGYSEFLDLVNGMESNGSAANI